MEMTRIAFRLQHFLKAKRNTRIRTLNAIKKMYRNPGDDSSGARG